MRSYPFTCIHSYPAVQTQLCIHNTAYTVSELCFTGWVLSLSAALGLHTLLHPTSQFPPSLLRSKLLGAQQSEKLPSQGKTAGGSGGSSPDKLMHSCISEQSNPVAGLSIMRVQHPNCARSWVGAEHPGVCRELNNAAKPCLPPPSSTSFEKQHITLISRHEFLSPNRVMRRL